MITLLDTQSVSGLQEWVDDYDLTHAVLLDPAFVHSKGYNPDNAIPSITVLEPGLVVANKDLPAITEDVVLQHLD